MQVMLRFFKPFLLLTLAISSVALAQEYPMQNRRVIWDESWGQPPVQLPMMYGPSSGTPFITNEVIISDVVVGRGNVVEQNSPDVLNIPQNVADGEPTLAAANEGPSIDDQLEAINGKIDDAVANLLTAHSDTSSFDKQVESITKQNDAIKKMLAERDEVLGKIEDSVAKQSAKADANAEAIEKLMSTVDGIAKRNPNQGSTQLKKQLQAQSAKIDSLSRKIAEASKAAESNDSADKIKALSGKVDAAIQAIGAGGNDGTEKAIASSNAKLDAAIKSIGDNANKLDALSKRKPANNGKAIGALKKQVAGQSGKIDELMQGADQQLADQAKRIEELAKKIDAANKSIAAGAKKAGSGAELKALSGKVDAAIQALGANEDSKNTANDVAAKFDDALAAIGDNSKKLDALSKKKPADNSKVIDSLKKQIDEQSKKIDQLMSGADGEFSAQEEKIDALAKKVDAAAKSIADGAKKPNDGSKRELKALSGKVDAAIQALGATQDNDDSKAVTAKLDEALKAISANAKRLEEVRKSSPSDEERQKLKGILEAQSAKLESLAKKVDASAKSQAKLGANSGLLDELKSNFSSQAKKSSEADRKLDALIKSLEDSKRANAKKANARLEKQAEQLKRMERELADAKRDAANNKRRVEEVQKEAKESEKRLEEYAKKMKEAEREDREEMADELEELVERLDDAHERLEEVSERASHLATHHAEHGEDGHGDDDEHGGSHGDESHHEKGHGGYEGHGDEGDHAEASDEHGAAGDAHATAHSKDASKGSEAEGDIDPLRKRLEAVKRRLEKAKKKK